MSITAAQAESVSLLGRLNQYRCFTVLAVQRRSTGGIMCGIGTVQ